MEATVFLFLNAIKIYHFKAKDPEIKDYTLCLSDISKYFLINNMKKNKIIRKWIFFSVVFNPIDTNDILDMHRYLMKIT